MNCLSRVRAISMAAVALLITSGVSAQTTNGRIIGTVTDEGGQGLAKVTITISSAAQIGGIQTRLTDDDGSFQFISLHPGEYTVTANLSGYVSQERQEVKVDLGGAASLLIAMPQARFESEIEVVADTPAVDPTQVNTEQVYDRKYLQQSAVGTRNRDYLVVVGQTAGVTGSDNPNVFGSTESENAYYIDGQDTTDPVTATWGTLYNYDAIEEVEIQTSGFEAEYGRATGGFINVVTKSGGNQFSGTLDIRYRDDSFQESGEHYDASTLDSSFQDTSATLGGPILRDRLWFFGAYEYVKSERTPSGSPTTRDFEGQNYNLKLTWQAGSSWRLFAKASGDPAEIQNDNADQFVAAEATSFQKQGSDLYTFELNGVLSDSLMWNTVIGAYRSMLDVTPMSGDLETPSHYDYGTFLTTNNYPNQQYSKRNRDDLATDLTWFVGDLAGSHELKFGLQYSGTEFPGASCSTGTTGGACTPGSVGYSYEDFYFLPYIMWEASTVGQQSYQGTLYTAYLQDSWRVVPNLTLKVGLRYDQVSYDNNANRQIADMNELQPRIGVAWDITNDAKNVVRGNWGRFMHPSALSLPYVLRAGLEPSYRWYSCATNLGVSSAEECEAFAGFLGFGYRPDDPDAMDPFGWVLPPWEIYGLGETLVQSDLRPTYADTLSLSYEREVGRRASLELTYVDKKTRDIFEDTCSGNYPVPSEGAECFEYLLGNLPGLARDYEGFILKYETRSFDWLTLLASYTYSKSKGNLEASQGNDPAFDVYPWHFDNRYGYLSDHRLQRFKLNGFFSIKGDWTIGFDGFWSSAFTWEPQVNPGIDPEVPYDVYYAEPRGSREAFDAYNLDLQLAKGFRVGNTVRLVLIGSVYNTFSTEYGTNVCNQVGGCGDYELGDATSWREPRSYELGFRLEF